MATVEASGVLTPFSTTSSYLPVKLEHENAVIPTRAHPTDAGLDLYAISDVTIQPKSQEIVETGISTAIPDGTVGLIFIRSSIGFKLNATLSNSVGVIDSSYRGTIKVAVTNHSHSTIEISTGDRIAQLVVIPILLLSPTTVDELPPTLRGTGGIGSSGR